MLNNSEWKQQIEPDAITIIKVDPVYLTRQKLVIIDILRLWVYVNRTAGYEELFIRHIQRALNY